MFCHVLLEYVAMQPATYEVYSLLKETTYVGVHMRSQTQRHPTMYATRLCPLQPEFNENFRQALERQQRFLWLDLERLGRDLVAGNFRLESVALTGVFTLHIQEPRDPPVVAGTPFATLDPVPAPYPPQTDSWRQHAASQKPWTASQLRMAPELLTHHNIDVSAEEGVDISSADDSRHLCLSYQLKGVCNSNCDSLN